MKDMGLKKMNNLKMSMVCPIHNEGQYLPYFLASLRYIEGEIDEKIFVLDNCTDNSKTLIKHYFPGAKIYEIYNHLWRFYAAESFQHGFEQASGDVILAVGADLVLDSDIISILQKQFVNKKVGMVCFRFLNYDLFSTLLRLHGEYNNLYMTMLQHIRNETRYTGVYAFRKQMMVEIGGLADIISEYDEYCRRVKQEGWNIVYITYTRILHLRSGLSAKKQFMQGVARYYLPSYNLKKTLSHSFIHLSPQLIVGYIHAKRYGLEMVGTLR